MGAAVVAALVAVVAVIAEGRRSRLQLGLGNLWRLIEQWDHPDMRRRRALVAQILIAKPEDRARASDEGIDILNTFELLAYLVRSETLRLEDAWINFSAWAVPWWYVYETGIERLRAQDETVFEDYKQLVENLIDYEARKRKLPRADLLPTAPILVRFLESEHALLHRLVPERQTTLLHLLKTLWRKVIGP